MKKTDSLVRLLLTDIEDKDILRLPVATLFISTAMPAASIDLVDSRLKTSGDNVHEIMSRQDALRKRDL